MVLDLTEGTPFDLTSGDFTHTLDASLLNGKTKIDIQIRLASMAAGNDNTICTVFKSLDGDFTGSTGGGSAVETNIVDTAADLTYANATHGTGEVTLQGIATQAGGFGSALITVTPTGAAAADTVEVFVLIS